MAAMRPQPRVFADGVTAEQLVGTEVAPLLGGTGQGERRGLPVLVMGGMTADRLAARVRDDLAGIVEYVPGAEAGLRPRVDAAAATGGFYLAVTTATGFVLDAAVLVCDGLESRGVLSREERFRVELALHELIANGLIHGNLGLSSGPKATPEQYAEYCALVQARLGSDEARTRWIEIGARWNPVTLTLSVRDQGSGYRAGRPRRGMDGTAAEAGASEDTSGRGLGIVRSLADRVEVREGGRLTRLRFRRDDPS